MKILQISSVYPVSDSPLDNSYVKTFIKYFRKRRDDEFVVLKPVTFLPAFLRKLSNKKSYWENKDLLIDKGEYFEDGLKIKVVPYFSIGSVSTIHAIFSSLIYLFNRGSLKVVVNENFDVIHAHFLFPDGYLAMKLSRKYGIPYVLTLRQEIRFLKSSISRSISRRIINNSAAVSTQSSQMKELVDISGMKADVVLLPTGIEDYFFKNNGVNRPSNSGLRLVSVCNLVPIKNLKSVITAISLMDNYEGLIYDIYGSGPEESELIKLTKELKLDHIITFKGRIENSKLPDIFPKYDVFIQPSYKETFGLSYFEALACGLPVILSENTGAFPLLKDRNVAFVVDPHDVNSIMNCIQEIIENRELLKEKTINCKEVAKIASWDNYVSFFEKKYDVAVNG